jgi:excisionase family DNA binding protein
MDTTPKHPVANFEQLPREVAEVQDKLDLIMNMLQGIINSKQPAGPKMLTVEEAAVLLKKKISTIYSMNSRGQLPVHHSGNTVVYFEDELLEWIKNNGKKSKDGETIEERADALASGMTHKASGTIERESKADEQKAIDTRVKQYEERQARLKAEMEQQSIVTESTDTTTLTTVESPAEEPASIQTDANPSEGQGEAQSISSFPLFSVEMREHTQTHQLRYVIVPDHSLTDEQRQTLQSVVNRQGGYFASFDGLFTFKSEDAAKQCCETIGKM